MKIITIFSLLIYWSIIILSPVISKDLKIANYNDLIIPVTKPYK